MAEHRHFQVAFPGDEEAVALRTLALFMRQSDREDLRAMREVLSFQCEEEACPTCRAILAQLLALVAQALTEKYS